jgi:hypothetical protein
MRDSQRTQGTWAFRATAAAVLSVAGAGCHSLGPRQIPVDRFDYNSAIANSANEQMLLNLVRLRFNEVPVFLAVNSVLTQYVWTGEVSVAGASGDSLGFPAWSVGGSGAFRYIERPTVTYSPLNGQEFAGQLISPVRADMVFTLVSSGWPPDQLLVMTLQRMNEIENLGFAPADRPTASEFARAVRLIIQLATRDAIELVRSASTDRDEPTLNFATSADTETLAMIREFKTLLKLDLERDRFRVTRKIVGRGPDEITIRMHSLLELMGLLSAGVEEPGNGAATGQEPAESDVPMRVRCVRERPVGAFVAVEFRGQWYYISNDDQQSKRAFGLMNYLFQMQASQNQGAGPLLTVPVG